VEAVLAVVAGVLVGGSVYLMLSRHVTRFLFGVVLFSNAVNLVLFAAGRLVWGRPALVPEGASAPLGAVANPLPQALILTAIVIGFGLLAFTLVLLLRAAEGLGTADLDAMRAAEPDPHRPAGPAERAAP
jgi:multicomponent Na+:H+ antiporter subunit C